MYMVLKQKKKKIVHIFFFTNNTFICVFIDIDENVKMRTKALNEAMYYVLYKKCIALSVVA